MGRGSGGRGSGSVSSDFSANYNFDIYTLQEDTQTPTTFNGAVENFRLSVTEFVEENVPQYDFTGVVGEGITLDIPNLSLQARQLTAGDPSTINGQPFESDLVANTDRIEYRFISDLLTSAGIDEFSLVIQDDDTGQPGFQVDGQTIDVNLATASGSSSESEAINYIIAEELLNSVDLFRISGGTIDNPDQIVPIENNTLNADGDTSEFAAFTPEAVDDLANTEVNTPVSIDVLANDNVGLIDLFDASSSQGGVITLDDNGTPDDSADDLLEYAPAADFSGSDSFNYTISNGTDTSTATVTVEVSALNPVEPVEPVDTVEPIDPPSEPVEPVDTVEPIDPPSEPVEPVDPPIEPIEPVDTVEPVDPPSEPVDPVDTVEPIDPPSETVEPPAEPVDSLFPTDPNFGRDIGDFLSGKEKNGAIADFIKNKFTNANGTNDFLTGIDSQDFLADIDKDDLLNNRTRHNLFQGQVGSDTFIFAKGGGIDFVKDFELGVDKIGLIEGELSFFDLTITSAGFTTSIKVTDTGETLAAIHKTSDLGELTEDMFVSVTDV